MKRTSYLQAALLVGAFCSLVSGAAWADLMINPTRVVFDKNQRAAQVDLINDGTKPVTYRVNLVNRRMTEDGQFQKAEQAAPGEQFADSMLVFSPRQFTLQPGGSQVVRVAVRKPGGLAPGEYRSHLSFDQVPDGDSNSNTNIENVNKQAAPGEISVQITALVGVSIPVIVREGQTDASVTLSDLALRAPAAPGQPPVLAVQLNRQGNRSIYGDFVVSFRGDDGKPVVLSRVGGVAVYVPNLRRRATINLQVPAGVTLARGTMSVVFQERAEEGGKPLADATLALP
ncbi:MAG: hypothetical protein JWP36_2540 [Paucimonas sp.]|nr:hypothetical protein [Paucimonas sp.]